MRIEDRIRTSAHRVADEVDPPAPDIDGIRRGAQAGQRRRIAIVAAVVATVLVTVVAPRLVNSPSSAPIPPLPANQPSQTASPLDTATWTLYKSKQYGFSLKHPPGWEVWPAERDWTLEDAGQTGKDGQEVFVTLLTTSTWPCGRRRPGTPETLEGIASWAERYCKQAGASCSGLDRSVPLCNGTDCDPGLLVTVDGDFVQAFFTGGKHKGQMIVVEVGRPEWHEVSRSTVVPGGFSKASSPGWGSAPPGRTKRRPIAPEEAGPVFGRDPWLRRARPATGQTLPETVNRADTRLIPVRRRGDTAAEDNCVGKEKTMKDRASQVLDEERTMPGRRALAVITVAIGAVLGAIGVSGASAAPPVGTDASEVTHWNQVAATTLAAVPGPNGAPHRHSRSTWAWFKEPCTTRSTRSGRSSTAHMFSTGAPVRRRPSTPPSQRRPTTCFQSSSRRHRKGRHSPSCGIPEHALLRVRQPRSIRSTTTPSRSRASRWDTQRPRQCSTRARATDDSAHLRGCRIPRPDTGSPSPPTTCRASTRPRGWAT